MQISVPATSANLGCGFDSLGLALDLRNRVVIQRANIFGISIKGEGRRNVKLKTNNLFVKIFYEHYKKIRGKRDKFKFTFYNIIPLSRGLGSSSAVIVGAIAAAYEIGGVVISKDKLINLALFYESHPDNITPAAKGGFTVSVTEGKKVISLKKEIPSFLKAVVVIPKKEISTSSSRAKLPRYYSKEDAVYNLSRSSLLTAAFFDEKWELLKEASKDRFHQEARMSLLPVLFDVQKTAFENGALMSTLSGSGSSFLNIVFEDDAKRFLLVMRKKFPQFNIMLLNIDNKGIVFE